MYKSPWWLSDSDEYRRDMKFTDLEVGLNFGCEVLLSVILEPKFDMHSEG